MKSKGLAFLCVFLGGVLSAEADSTALVTVGSEQQQVEVQVRGVRAKDQMIELAGQHLRVALDGDHESQRIELDDITVRQIKIVAPSTLEITLRHGRRTTGLIASFARVTPVDGGLRVWIPRKTHLAALQAQAVAKEVVTSPPKTAPIQTAPVAVVASPATADVKPISKIESVGVHSLKAEPVSSQAIQLPSQPNPSDPPELTAAKPVQSPSQPIEMGVADVTTAAVATAIPALLPHQNPALAAGGAVGVAVENAQSGTLSTVLGFVALLLGGGILFWWFKQRQESPQSTGSLLVLASRSLGGKTRIVLMSAANQELLLAIGDKGVQLLSKWDKETSPDPTHAKAMRVPRASDFGGLLAEANGAGGQPLSSPSVSGIMKLRGRKESQVSEHVATEDEDADAEWATELLLATRSGKPRGVC